MLLKKVVDNGSSFELNVHFDSQLKTSNYLIKLFFNSKVSSIGW